MFHVREWFVHTTLPCLYCRGLLHPHRLASIRTQLSRFCSNNVLVMWVCRNSSPFWDKCAMHLCEECKCFSFVAAMFIKCYTWKPYTRKSEWSNNLTYHSYTCSSEPGLGVVILIDVQLPTRVPNHKFIQLRRKIGDFIYTYLQIHNVYSCDSSYSAWSGSF